MTPVIDLDDPQADEQVIEACRTTGFFAVRNHGIAEQSLRAMRRLCIDLFSSDAETKRANSITPDNYRGFIPLGFFSPNRPEINGVSADGYEGFKLHWECPPNHPVLGQSPLYGTNRWVSEVAQMPETVRDYWRACDLLADRLLNLVADFLGVSGTTMKTWHEAPLTNMTLLHYPACRPGEIEASIHPHKDSNVFTFLYPDPIGGLELRNLAGGWIEVEAPQDALLVNTGEMLELWSGGHIVATPHRATNRSDQSRYSFPWVLVPNHDVVVEPLIRPRDGFTRPKMPVGAFSAEVWGTNWPDAVPSDAGHDLGSLDR